MDRAFIHAEGKLTAAQALEVLHALADFIPQIQQAFGILLQKLARVGQLDLASAAHQQRLADRFLELPDDDADRGLSPVELLCGAGEALLIGNREKHLQLRKIHPPTLREHAADSRQSLYSL